MGVLLHVRSGDEWVPIEVPNDALIYLTVEAVDEGRGAKVLISRPLFSRPIVSINVPAAGQQEQVRSPSDYGPAEITRPSSFPSRSQDRG